MKQLKTKFILLSMTALLVLLSLIVGSMCWLNYRSVVQEADALLTVLSGNRGRFPALEPGGKPDVPMLPPEFSPEVPYESRFFSISYSTSGQVSQVDINRIAAVDRENAIYIAGQALTEAGPRGFIGPYRYARSQEPEGLRITFLDCGRKLEALRRFCVTGITMALLGFGLVFAVIFVMAGRIIRPIAQSYEKQRRFITDASHELKTPLTIIHTNADILEMELGPGNESLADIRSQTQRLRSLTEELVLLSRMEESGPRLQTIDFPISEAVAEAAHEFAPLFAREGKQLLCQIQPLLTLCGDDRSIRQLVSILLENALKYAPVETAAALTLARQGRSLQLTVSNAVCEPIAPQQLSLIFDRFYRTDTSRNSETGGHGIGLSIAKAIVTAHGGKIKASCGSDRRFSITITLPV